MIGNSLEPYSKSDPMQKVDNSTLSDKYWKLPLSLVIGSGGVVQENLENIVVIHHMKYFEKFLAENENGYDDIDISVHCDVEVFEWLMAYIHDPDQQYSLDKSIVVSILISSEFLQMDGLVDLCLENISHNLNDIIKLPIDLSCISEKLVNKLAFITHPTVLARTKDKKDKILNKLYKRRVELDFSRKSGSRGGTRTIAASLTCCMYCGSIFLDHCVSSLSCKNAPPTVDFRGRLVSPHFPIPGWSLTSYLKTLHSGGMAWDGIYWHVWAACIVFQVDSSHLVPCPTMTSNPFSLDGVGLCSGPQMVSALEADRYSLQPDGLLIRPRTPAQRLEAEDEQDEKEVILPRKDIQSPRQSARSPRRDREKEREGRSSLSPRPSLDSLPPPDDIDLPPPEPRRVIEPKAKVENGLDFSLSFEEGFLGITPNFKLPISLEPHEFTSLHPQITPTLNPARPLTVLTQEIYDLLVSQMKHISGLSDRKVIETTTLAMTTAARASEDYSTFDFGDVLWGEPQLSSSGEEGSGVERGRSRSPPKGNGLKEGRDGRKLAHSLSSKHRDGPDSDSEAERRSRSLSSGARLKGLAPSGRLGPSHLRKGPTSGLTTLRASAGSSKSNLSASITPPVQSFHSIRSPQSGFFRFCCGSDEGSPPLYPASLYKALLPEVCRQWLHRRRSQALGIWLLPHPLAMQPSVQSDLVSSILEGSNNGGSLAPLSYNKRLEWVLDVMREYDEKKMDRLESFLMSCRNSTVTDPEIALALSRLRKQTNAILNPTSNAQNVFRRQKPASALSSSFLSSAGGVGLTSPEVSAEAFHRGDYYRDRGRLPTKQAY